MSKITPTDSFISAMCGVSVQQAKTGNRQWIMALLAGLLTLGLDAAAQAAPGDLDPSFDADGRVVTHFDGFDEALALVAQADGKLVAAGTAFTSLRGRGIFALARYLPDGQLDRGFGRKGRVRTGFAGRSASIAALAIQIDTKLVAAGSASAGGISSDFAVARYNPDGSLDPSFGSGGQVLTNLGFSDDRANALALQPDGKIVTAGVLETGAGRDFALVRYNSDGTLDNGFGSGGRVLTDFGDFDEARSLVLQSDGKLVAAGSSIAGGISSDFAVARYNPDGSLDPGFGSGGQVLTDLGGRDRADALALQPDGKIVAAGMSRSKFVALVRYNPDGSLDTGFGSGGRVLTAVDGSVGGGRSLSLVLQADGKLVTAGGSFRRRGQLDFALLRYNVDGSPDATFGTTGLVVSSFGGQVSADAQALALQADGKLVAVGTSITGVAITVCIRRPPLCAQLVESDFALARYLVTDALPRLPPKCGGRRATILGTPRNDTIRGTRANDIILGRGGNDTIRGLDGNDIICGGTGNDTLLGNEGGDRLLGESGNDRLFGDVGGNTLDGGSGRDSCTPNRGSKRCETQGATRPRDPPDPTPPPCSPVTNVPCVQ